MKIVICDGDNVNQRGAVMNPIDKIFWTITISQLLFYFLWAMAKDIAKSDRDDEDLTGDMPCKVFGCRRTALFESEFCLDHMRYHNNPGLQYEEYPEVGQPTPNTQSADPVAGSESKNPSQWWDIISE